MKSNAPHPLRLQPPQRTADEGLGERLALLARASAPTPTRPQARHRARWRAPFAGLAIVVATGGLAYGAQSVVHHVTRPTPVAPGGHLSPRTSASPATGGGLSSLAPAPETSRLPTSLPHRHGTQVGTGPGRAPTSAPGHTGAAPGKHLANGAGNGNRSGQGHGRANGKANGRGNSDSSANGKKLGQTAAGGNGQQRGHQQQAPGSKGQPNGG
jgi:hypothetical protein